MLAAFFWEKTSPARRGADTGYTLALAGRGAVWIHYCCREGDWLDKLLQRVGGLAAYITAAERGTGWIYYCCREGDWLDKLLLQGG